MKYVITGTQVYGPARDDSDLDIVVLADDVQSINEFIIKHGIEIYQTQKQKDYDGGGFYFELFGIEVNIIIATDDAELKHWEAATEEMKTIEPIKNREERVITFRKFFNDKEFCGRF